MIAPFSLHSKKDKESSARMFFSLSMYCSQFPYRVWISCFLASLILSLGVFYVTIQNDPEKLWVPSTSATATQQGRFNQLFGAFFRVEQLILYAEREDLQSDLIEREYLELIAKLQSKIEQMRIIDSRFSAGEIGLEDFCYRPIAGKGCLVMSPFQYWLNNISILEGDPDIKLTTACQTTDPILKDRAPCMDAIGVPVMQNVVFGGISRDTCHTNPDPCGQSTPKASALVVTFLLENKLDNSTYTQMAEQWEEKVFLDIAKRFQDELALPGRSNSTQIRLAYMAQRSVSDALKSENSQNALVAVASYFIMFLYVSMTLGTWWNPVSSRFGLGLTGILIVFMSLAISMSICATIFHIEVTMITLEVVPFLILAIGVDNMFILTDEFDRQKRVHGYADHDIDPRTEKSSPGYPQTSASSASGYPRSRSLSEDDLLLQEITCQTMANVGPSIVVAAVSESLAYFVGTLTKIPALETFCVVAAVAVLVDLILQLTWFMSAIVLDAHRVRARRYDLFPWIRKREEIVRGAECAKAKVSSLQEFIQQQYTPFLMKKRTKTAVLALSGSVFLLSLCVLPQIPLGLEQELAVPTDHYLHEYFQVQTKFSATGPPAYVTISEKIEYTDSRIQEKLLGVLDQLSSLHEYIQLPVYSWLNTFNQWRQMRYFLHGKIAQKLCDCPSQPLLPFAYEQDHSKELSLADLTPDAEFYPLTKNFTDIPIDSQCCQNYGICGAQYQKDIIFETSDHRGYDKTPAIIGIKGSRFRFQVNALRNQTMFINSYYYLQKMAKSWSQSIPIFVYSLYFVYYEQYTYIQGVGLQSILLALGVVFVAVFLLIDRNVRLSLLVVIGVFGIVISQLGFIFLINQQTSSKTSVNAVSVVNLLAAVGLGVEFCAHLTHHFAVSQRRQPTLSAQDHTASALAARGSPIIAGITLTKTVGIGVLAFAPSLLFRVYFFRMYLGIVLFGAFYGVAVLPVLLSIFGQRKAKLDDSSIFLLSEELDDVDAT
uniref:ResistanceNodulationCell Division (RND) Superfamily putative n=1 Tax=Albugo laibachii Nc14 TaxID=890382 RepID=F0WDX3_9STRA|nr:ResistanceNodulationCell Division (RND) Superfamily putative [Albugo laibachii Nc14]|eukprot:CCA19401.1 ResistanceNodulationCell Division (RND) Superfamily putative [Albugo laibachii Nc14]